MMKKPNPKSVAKAKAKTATSKAKLYKKLEEMKPKKKTTSPVGKSMSKKKPYDNEINDAIKKSGFKTGAVPRKKVSNTLAKAVKMMDKKKK